MADESIDLATIEGRLRRARELAGFAGPAEAAREFGWTYSTYAGHENGSRGIKLGSLRGYAAAFSVSFSWLAEGKGSPKVSGSRKVADAWERMGPEDRAMYEQIGEQLAQRSRQKKIIYAKCVDRRLRKLHSPLQIRRRTWPRPLA